MVTPVIIPKLGNTVESCMAGLWRKKEGEKVRKGDILLEIETDKTTFEVEAPASGILLEIFFNEGDIVPVLTNIAVIGEKNEEIESYRPKTKEVKKTLSKQLIKEENFEETRMPVVDKGNMVNQPTTMKREQISTGISPRAKQFAQRHNIKFDGIEGSGPRLPHFSPDLDR